MARRVWEKQPSWIEEHIPPELATSSIFRFDVRMPDGTVVSVDLLQSIDAEYNNLEEQLQDTSQQFIWYACILAELKAQVYVLDRKCKARRGVLTNEAIHVAKDVGIKPSADQVKAIIEADPTLNKMETILALAQKHANKLHHMCDAVRMKSEHLRSLAGFKRQERDVQR